MTKTASGRCDDNSSARIMIKVLDEVGEKQRIVKLCGEIEVKKLW